MNILLLMPDGTQRESGVGYIKMDYNIEPGVGTEVDAESAGEGLLEHERAYLAWLDTVFEKYPDLVIENCSSGGLRMDYALLSRLSIQSTSDQEEYDIFGGRGTACAHQSGSYNHGGI